MAVPVAGLDKIFPLPIAGELFYKVGYYFFYKNSKAKQLLDFNPRTSIESAVQDSYQWYQRQGIN
jgi:nucleoside-diphosphate-sugar epimerase